MYCTDYQRISRWCNVIVVNSNSSFLPFALVNYFILFKVILWNWKLSPAIYIFLPCLCLSRPFSSYIAWYLLHCTGLIAIDLILTHVTYLFSNLLLCRKVRKILKYQMWICMWNSGWTSIYESMSYLDIISDYSQKVFMATPFVFLIQCNLVH